MKVTIRELRQTLTEIENQNMTVKELRAILFEQEEQERELYENDLLKLAYGKKQPKRPVGRPPRNGLPVLKIAGQKGSHSMTIADTIWAIRCKVYRELGDSRATDRALDPLLWYIQTGRAPLDFERLIKACTPRQLITIANRLVKHSGKDYLCVIRACSHTQSMRI